MAPAPLALAADVEVEVSEALAAVARSGTRLVTRLRARCRGPAALPTALLLELADFPMTRRCLLGIRARAERSSPRAVTP